MDKMNFNEINFHHKKVKKVDPYEGNERFVLKVEKVAPNPKKPNLDRFTVKVWDRVGQKMVYAEACYTNMLHKHYKDARRHYKAVGGIVEITNDLI